MVRIYFIVIALLLASGGYGAERSVPSSKPKLEIGKIDDSDSIRVILLPASKGSTRIWRQGNSWGAANWRVLVIRGANLFLFREDPDQVFTLNTAQYTEMRGPEKTSLDLRAQVWIGPKAEFGTFRSGDKVIVVYDVPVTAEARQYGVWYGTISAMASFE